jgi:hypothetical protein
MADIIAIQKVGVFAAPVQFHFQGIGQGGFSSSRQAGEPDDFASMTVQAFPVPALDGQALEMEIAGGSKAGIGGGHGFRWREDFPDNIGKITERRSSP